MLPFQAEMGPTSRDGKICPFCSIISSRGKTHNCNKRTRVLSVKDTLSSLEKEAVAVEVLKKKKTLHVEGDDTRDNCCKLRTFEEIRELNRKWKAEAHKKKDKLKDYMNCSNVPISIFPQEGLVEDYLALPLDVSTKCLRNVSELGLMSLSGQNN